MGFIDFATDDVLTEESIDTIMRQTVIPCTSGTRPASPHEGMTVYETDTDVIAVYTGSGWKRYAVNLADIMPLQDEDGTSITGISSTSFIPGSPVVKVTFVAPPSGAVVITVTGRIAQTSNGNEAQLGWILRAGAVVGSGTIIADVSVDRCVGTGQAVNVSGPAGVTASNRWMKTSLTPGTTYHAYTVHRTTTAGNAAVYYRHLLVEPVA